MKPWERFQQQQDQQPGKPWERFQGAQEPEPSPVMGALTGAVNYVAGIPGAVYESVVGKQDPAFADVAKNPSIERASGIVDPSASMFGVTDAAYGDIYKKSLGDRFLGSTKDKHGYEVVKFRDKDGSIKQAYVNKPGLDWMDVDRGVASALPYVLGGGLAGQQQRALVLSPAWLHKPARPG